MTEQHEPYESVELKFGDIKIPHDAILVSSSTSMELNETFKTSLHFRGVGGKHECDWYVEKVNGQIVSINMRHTPFDHEPSIIPRPEKITPLDIDDIISGKFADHYKTKIEEQLPEKPRPKRRILL